MCVIKILIKIVFLSCALLLLSTLKISLSMLEIINSCMVYKLVIFIRTTGKAVWKPLEVTHSYLSSKIKAFLNNSIYRICNYDHN